MPESIRISVTGDKARLFYPDGRTLDLDVSQVMIGLSLVAKYRPRINEIISILDKEEQGVRKLKTKRKFERREDAQFATVRTDDVRPNSTRIAG